VKAHLATLVLLTFWARGLNANECLAPKPLTVTTICGRVVDPTGGSIPNAELRLLDPEKNVAASIHADLKGNFVFPRCNRATTP
jgi:hypothetical protein